MSIDNSSLANELDFNTPAAKRFRKLRALKDKTASVGIAFGGLSVIFAILLIFFYLLYEVAPLFQSATMERWHKNGEVVAPYNIAGEGETLYLTMEEQAEIGLRVTDTGNFIFFDTLSGTTVSDLTPDLPAGVTVTSFALISDGRSEFALGLSDGSALVVRHKYKASYPDGKRVLTPYLEYPAGKAPVQVANGPIDSLAVNGSDTEWAVVALSKGTLSMTEVSLTQNFITGELTANTTERSLPQPNGALNKILMTPDLRWLLGSVDGGKVMIFDLRSSDDPILLEVSGSDITEIELLLGGNSLMLADSNGEISQWFFVRDANNDWDLTKIRSFEAGNKSITSLSMEHRRKGFATVDTDGILRIYNSTADRLVIQEKVSDGAADYIAIGPRSNALLVEAQGQFTFWKVENEHPEISVHSLWEEVWYEGYEEPEYTWQSSAANNDFEPKYSLVPLAFGTLKAAFYAMLVATPLAICGAIYTAYFMIPVLRRKVKPFIELMEALPTVILGFLAGLWLAPFMETNLAGIFVTLLVLPASILAFAFAWANVPKSVRYLIPEGWDSILLIPVVILATLFSLWIADGVEVLLFGGDMRLWISDEVGIPYDQRNALVVGIAMGFAVIPTIFSITEDAIFAVPKHLSYGSLALGATPWQTLTRVVLPTASPGIFSAVMIGMGRAVGETMIVLMATGNTPIMDMNIFEGMRTLAANIAVEMPESAVGSTHYRILFLAAFVLFLFTFFVNTLAETIRQHLRKKYGSL